MSENEIKNDEAEVNASNVAPKVAAPTSDTPKAEISGMAIARMMGVASSSELKILESKIDLVASRLTALAVKLEKVISQFSRLPTGSDMERIDVQIGSLKTLVRDLIVISGGTSKADAGADANRKTSGTTEVVTADGESA